MSDQEAFKKSEELEALDLFIVEYRLVTGKRIHSCSPSERPDFLCLLGDTEIGIELVRVMTDPESRLWREIHDREPFMDAMDTMIHLQEAVYQKEEKRRVGSWQRAEHTILVVAVHDAPLPDMAKHLDPVDDADLYAEMSETGFREIWAADFTIVESFYTVQLLGIKPTEYRGLHSHHSSTWKPYG